MFSTDVFVRFMPSLATQDVVSEYLAIHTTTQDVVSEYLAIHTMTQDVVSEYLAIHTTTQDVVSEYLAIHTMTQDAFQLRLLALEAGPPTVVMVPLPLPASGQPGLPFAYERPKRKWAELPAVARSGSGTPSGVKLQRTFDSEGEPVLYKLDLCNPTHERSFYCWKRPTGGDLLPQRNFVCSEAFTHPLGTVTPWSGNLLPLSKYIQSGK